MAVEVHNARQQEETEQRRLKAWAMYHDHDDNRTVKDKAAALGVSTVTFHRYIAALTVRFRDSRSQEMADVLTTRLASSGRILAKVEERLLQALDADEIEGDAGDDVRRILADVKVLHDVYHKRLEQESKWLGLDAPTKHQVEDTTVTVEELALARKHATEAEAAQLRSLMDNPKAQNELAKSIARRAQLAAKDGSETA